MDSKYDDNKLLPEDIISFDDTTPYHEVEMYKKMMRYHIGLITRAIAMNNFDINHPINTTIRGSFPKIDEIQANYNSCDRDRQIEFPIVEDVEYIYLGKFDCYSVGCFPSKKIHVFKYENTLFICAEQGERYLDIYNYKKMRGEKNSYGEVDSVFSYGRFFDILIGIREHLNTSNQLVLIGHSNGMASSILTAFLLCCIKNKDFYNRNLQYFDHRMEGFLEILADFQDIYDSIKRITLFVAGTGGFPILFQSQKEFKDFYEELKGRYVHIVNGFMDKGTIFSDFYASPLVSLINIKFGLYYHTKSIVFPITKYEGTQCFYDIVIDDINATDYNYERKWKKIDKTNDEKIGRPIFYKEGELKHYYNPTPLFLSSVQEKYKNINFLKNSVASHNLHQLSFYRDVLAIYFFSK